LQVSSILPVAFGRSKFIIATGSETWIKTAHCSKILKYHSTQREASENYFTL